MTAGTLWAGGTGCTLGAGGGKGDTLEAGRGLVMLVGAVAGGTLGSGWGSDWIWWRELGGVTMGAGKTGGAGRTGGSGMASVGGGESGDGERQLLKSSLMLLMAVSWALQ